MICPRCNGATHVVVMVPQPDWAEDRPQPGRDTKVKEVECDLCRGWGSVVDCNDCDGKGEKTTTVWIASGDYRDDMASCDTCDGEKVVPDESGE